MPSPTHEFFVNLFADAILDELKSIGREDSPAGIFAARVRGCASLHIYLKDGVKSGQEDGGHKADRRTSTRRQLGA